MNFNFIKVAFICTHQTDSDCKFACIRLENGNVQTYTQIGKVIRIGQFIKERIKKENKNRL